MAKIKSFTQVEGWRESFKAAAEKQETIRAGSLFPEVPQTLLGEEVRALTLADWTLLAVIAKNPFFSSPFADVSHASNIVWVLKHRVWLARMVLRAIGNGRFTKLLRKRLFKRILKRYAFDKDRIVNEVNAFIADAFMDSPNYYAPDDRKPKGINPTKMPQVAFEISACGEIMEAFPSFTFDKLRTMALPQFWQWLHSARKIENPDYKNHQLTDFVNRDANAEYNRIRREEKSAKQKPE